MSLNRLSALFEDSALLRSVLPDNLFAEEPVIRRAAVLPDEALR